MTSPPPTRLSRIPKLRLNDLPDIIFNSADHKQKFQRWYWPKRITLPWWVDALVEFDYEELIEREGRGRKPSLPPEKEEDFKIELDNMQVSFQGGRITAKNIKPLLTGKFDGNYSDSGVYSLLDRLNIVWISGRSKHPKSSEEVILAFKENFPDEVEKIKNKFRTIISKSGGQMKAELARREA